MAVERQDRSYRLEPLDTTGVFLGLGPVQCGLLGAGITMAVLALTAGLPLPVGAVPLLGAVTVSFANVGGHPAWEWLPLAACWFWATLRRGRRWVAPLPLLPTDEAKPPPLPPCLVGLEVIEVPWRGPLHLAAVRDRERQTLTALVPVRGPQFVLEPRGEQERLLAGWGDVFAQFAVEGGPVTHLFWSDFACPSAPESHVAPWDDEPRSDRPSPERDSYQELLDLAAASATTHETVVGITVARNRTFQRRSGSVGGVDPLQRALTTGVDGLVRGLQSAGVTVDDPLDTIGLHRLIRRRVDPLAGAARPRRQRRLTDRLGLVTPASSGPLVVDTAWRHVRVDAAWHRTWWVACWPRLAVPPSWLEPFLSSSGVARTMTVALVPVPARQSRRRIERDLVKFDSDAATKEDKGRRIDARHHRATQALLDREAELVAGYAEMAYVGLVSVAAHSEDQLDEQSEIVEHLARQAGMELRLLDGRQDLAWAAALPLGLAPKTLVGS